MKRFLSLLTLFCAVSALAQTPPVPLETVTVTGTGKARLTPDRYSFNVGVQTIGTTVDDAVRENNDRVASVIDALKKAGATAAEIRTSNFTIYPQQDYQQGKLPRITGYQVNNSITVTRDKVGDAGKLLQAALNAGVNNSSGLQFLVSDPARGRDEGMRAAFADAKAKATTLAQAAGRTVGRALTISEGVEPSRPPVVYQAMAMAPGRAAANEEVAVESGTQEVSYTITVVFELR
ncbi:MAG TPA: SIMPL domain-containing protein [Thermoanaerobaculia bacterium]|nr:SIMPL domain-containing protein [Thermoanaerobaculia bacterium]